MAHSERSPYVSTLHFGSGDAPVQNCKELRHRHVYLAISLMSLALLMLLQPTYAAPYCVTQTMFYTN